MLDAAKKFAKKHGKTIDEILLEFIYGETEVAMTAEGDILDNARVKVATKDRIACIKLWKEFTHPKLSEGGAADQEGPSVFLPERHPRLDVVDGGKPTTAAA